MSYTPTTDFLALLRQTGGGVRTERMPGLDYVIAALVRAGLCTVQVGQTAPTVNQSTTLWFKPAASGSWAAEGAVFLYNLSTAQYEPANPVLWSSLLLASALPPSQLPGTTTNDNARAGNVGEYVSSSVPAGAGLALTTGVPVNVTSILLTPGDWDVSGLAGFVPANTTSVTQLVGSVSTVSGALNTNPGNLVVLTYPATVYNGATQSDVSMSPVRISIAVPTIVYLVAQSNFTVSANLAFGLLRARRVR